MLKGFKDFIMRGNVVELAIAVVIGTAFQAVVSSFTSAIITPIINAFPGASSNGFGFSIRHGDKFTKNGANTTFINFSTIINAIIVFLITALVVYFIFVVPMNKFQERRARKAATGEPDPTPKPDEILLLEQIRDLLQQQAGPGSGTEAAPSPSPRPIP